MTTLPYARFILPAGLVLLLVILAVAMLVQGAAPAASPAAPDGRRAAAATDPVPERQRPSLAWPLALVAIIGLSLAACGYLYATLQRVRQQRTAGAAECEHLRRGLGEAQALNARLHAELERRTEQVKSLDVMLRGLRSAERSRQKPPLRAPEPAHAAVAAGQQLLHAEHEETPLSPGPTHPYPSNEETLVGPVEPGRPTGEMHGNPYEPPSGGQADHVSRREEELRQMEAKNADLFQKWRDCQRARLEEQEAFRRQREDARARIREELEASFAARIRELEAECERLRAALDRQMAKMWPAAFLAPELDGLRRVIAHGMEAEPPEQEAVALFGMLHQLCASAGTERAREAAFEMSRAFYTWYYMTGQANPEWDEELARWLTEFLKGSRVRVVAVKPGEPISARLHSPEGSGHQVRRPLSFLVLREDGTPYKRALVAT